MRPALLFVLALLLVHRTGYAETRPKKNKVYSGQYAVRQIPQNWQAVETTQIEAPSRVMNLRIHPLHLVPMLTQKDTRVSLRADVDIALGSRVTLGPSVTFRQTSKWDSTALTGGSINGMNETLLELGLLSNIYFTGNTSEGGFLVRPHVYWIDAQGERNNNNGNIGPGSSQPGWRAGTEVVFQKILPSGFNFEIGAGLTYHFVPYSIQYAQPASTSAPESNVMPTITAGIGWAF